MERKEPQRIVIERRWPKAGYTIGRLYVDNVLWFNTLEDTDRGLDQSMTVVAIKARKVYGQTAIPKGTYKVKLSYSAKFAGKAWCAKYNGLVPEITGVKGFSGVRIHPGNSAADTYGCVLVGQNTLVGYLTSSAICYYRLMDDVFMPAHLADETVTLEIV